MLWHGYRSNHAVGCRGRDRCLFVRSNAVRLVLDTNTVIPTFSVWRPSDRSRL